MEEGNDEMKSVDEHAEENRIAVLRKIPATISKLEESMREANQIKQDLTQEKNAVYQKITQSVLSRTEETEDGSKPRYTNEQSRRNAIALEKEKNTELAELTEKQKKNMKEGDALLIKLSYYHNFMRIEEIIARLRR